MPRVTGTPIPPGIPERVAAAVQTRVVLATARVETAMKQKVSTPGPPRSRPGNPPHVDTGQLRQSIHSSVERDGQRIVGVVSAPVEYAAKLEYGTATAEPRPFARATLAEERGNVAAILGAPGLVK